MNHEKVNCFVVFDRCCAITLGAVVSVGPNAIFGAAGSQSAPADIAYPLGMLAARFLTYGVGMFFIARTTGKHLFWINNMILIQAIDLAVGIFYTATGVVGLALSGFPMFNATLFIILLTLWRPRTATTVPQSRNLSPGS